MTLTFPRLIALGAALILTLAACTGDDSDDGGGGSDGQSPEDRLATAKAAFDDAASIEIDIVGEETPSGANALLSASGIGDASPAFEGDISIEFGGGTEVAVIAVDDEVYIQGTALFPTWTAVDPATFGAPDPATFFETETGVLSLIDDTTDLEEGEERRDDSDGSLVISEISGTIAGSDVQRFLDTADENADFDVVYALTEDDDLQYIRMTGPFYGTDAGDATYVIEATPSDDEADISAP